GAAMTGTDMYSISTVLQHGQPDFYLEPLSPWRQSDAWEGLRARSDRRAADGPRPNVFLANLGPIPAHKARSAWTGNLFAAAGIGAVANDGFESVDDLVAAYLESGAGMAAICGSDADYAVSLVPAIEGLKGAGCAIIIVAGRPGDREDVLREVGAHGFVFVGADVFAVVRQTLDMLGVPR
ncbi:MAG: hypothetical protein WBG86_15100, partial [Polyangiales bacterium]